MRANWIRAAMADDTLVAELLLHLSRSDSRPLRRSKPSPPLPPLAWGIRQPRSKAAASLSKEHDARRRSPTTPLAWTASGFGSDAASPSDCSGESSRPIVLAPRFKGSATPDTTNSESASKRSRKKRTFAELIEEESSLLKHKKDLNKQLESLHMKLEEQKSFNENLKRMKLDLHSQSAAGNKHMGQHTRIMHPEREASASASASEAASTVSKKIKSEEIAVPHRNSSKEQHSIFVLPDLNMMPGEDLAPDMMR